MSDPLIKTDDAHLGYAADKLRAFTDYLRDIGVGTVENVGRVMSRNPLTAAVGAGLEKATTGADYATAFRDWIEAQTREPQADISKRGLANVEAHSRDVARAVIGETPAEIALGGVGLPGKVAKLGAGALSAGLASEDADAIFPGGRSSMLTVRAQALRALRDAARGADTGEHVGGSVMSLEPLAAREQAKRGQREINIAQKLDQPLAPPDTRGYSLFDYSKLGRDIPMEGQYSLIRPQPGGGKSKGDFGKLPDEIQSMVADPYVYENMKRAVLRGEKFKDWYDIRQYRDALLNEGMTPEEFKRYMGYQQAAAQNIRPSVQTRVGNYLWSQDKSGLLTPETMFFPPRYGAKTQKNVWNNSVGIYNDEPISSEKLLSYGENFGGNLSPSTVDTHGYRLPAMLSHDPRMLVQGARDKYSPDIANALRDYPNVRIAPDKKGNPAWIDWSPKEAYEAGKMNLREAIERPGIWSGVPKGARYGATEQYLWSPIAEELGMFPGQAQAGGWVGGGGITGLASKGNPKLMLQLFEDEIANMGRDLSMTPAQVIRGIAKGKLY